jgi:hypothetical protein
LLSCPASALQKSSVHTTTVDFLLDPSDSWLQSCLRWSKTMKMWNHPSAPNPMYMHSRWLHFRYFGLLVRQMTGLTVSQIFTDRVPFHEYRRHPATIIHLIQKGRRPKRDNDFHHRISDDVWRVMEACWVTDPGRRPSAKDVICRL